MTLMKNRSLLKVLFVVLAAGLLTSCMGLDETDPSSLSVPQVKTFEVKAVPTIPVKGLCPGMSLVIISTEK